ncbi:hypothetical protein [Streptomyces sp. NPDC049590]|uniref:hypothetical protein n=1 Tax=Streptomyces sp. NPDC049590 TaxID=3154834 RepID=UPI00343A4181
MADWPEPGLRVRRGLGSSPGDGRLRSRAQPSGAVGEEVITPNGIQRRYAYDPLGRRISKHRVADDCSAADRAHFFWEDLCLAEQATADDWVTTWDYAPDSPRPVECDLRHRPATVVDTQEPTDAHMRQVPSLLT